MEASAPSGASVQTQRGRAKLEAKTPFANAASSEGHASDDQGSTTHVAPGRGARPAAAASDLEAMQFRDSAGACSQVSEWREPLESNWLSRVQCRAAELRAVFRISGSENVLDDFVCALSKKILLQGRMYVFEQHVCFHSSIFGYIVDKVIALKDVTSVRKRKHCGFPNSIEIVWRGKTEVFTSFLSRDEAFGLITLAWRQVSPYAKLFGIETGTSASEVSYHHGPARGGADAECLRPLNGLSPASSNTQSVVIHPVRDGHVELSMGGGDRKHDSSPSSSPQRPLLNDLARSGMSQPRISITSAEGAPEPTSAQESELSDLEVTGRTAYTAPAAPPEDLWEPSLEPAPPVPPDMKLMVCRDLECSAEGFFRAFVAEPSEFFATFHAARGDRAVQVSQWRQHTLGVLRELTFISTVKVRMAPPQARCHQTQRYRVFAGGAHLVFETSQTVSDIPYGDHFSVETRWDVSPRPPGPGGASRSQVQIHLMIPFIKSTVFKRTIEKSTSDSCLAAHMAMLDRMQAQLAAAAARDGPPLPAPLPALARLLGPTPARHSPRPSFSRTHSPRRSLRVRRLASERNASGPLPPAELVARAPAEFQDDVARMLHGGPHHGGHGGEEPAASPLGSVHRTRRRRPLSGRVVRPDSACLPSSGGGLLAATMRWLAPLRGGVVAQPLVLAAVLLLGLAFQVALLLTWRQPGASASHDAVFWARRLEGLRLELQALHTRVEVVGAELEAAMRHLALGAA